MKNNPILVSGLINIETTIQVDSSWEAGYRWGVKPEGGSRRKGSEEELNEQQLSSVRRYVEESILSGR